MSTVKMGRPTGNPKDTRLRMRVDKDTLMMLDKCAKAMIQLVLMRLDCPYGLCIIK